MISTGNQVVVFKSVQPVKLVIISFDVVVFPRLIPKIKTKITVEIYKGIKTEMTGFFKPSQLLQEKDYLL